MSGENGQGWITEEAFFTISPGARQVGQRTEVKMNLLSPAERREFLKSLEVEWQTLLKNQAAKVPICGRNGPSSSALAGLCDGHSLGAYLEARRQQAIGAPCEGTTHHKGFHRPDLLDIESHSPTLTREGFFHDSLAVRVQPWTQVKIRGRAASVQHSGPDQERTTPLRQNAARWSPQVNRVKSGCNCSRQFVNWPMARESGGTVSLLPPEDWVFETSVLEPCVLVLTSPQQRHHGILGMANSDIAGGGHEVWEQAISKLKKRFTCRA